MELLDGYTPTSLIHFLGGREDPAMFPDLQYHGTGSVHFLTRENRPTIWRMPE